LNFCPHRLRAQAFAEPSDKLGHSFPPAYLILRHSAIYRHDTSKEEIIIALLEYLAKGMDESDTNAINSE